MREALPHDRSKDRSVPPYMGNEVVCELCPSGSFNTVHFTLPHNEPSGEAGKDVCGPCGYIRKLARRGS